MAIQLAYNTDPAVAIEGQLGGNSPAREVVSRLLSTGSVAAGRLVVRDVSDTTIRLPTSAGDIAATVGATLYDASKPPFAYGAPLWNGTRIPPMVPVLRKGRVWVIVEENVTQSMNVYVRFAAGAGGTNLGAFRASDDSGTAAQLGSARYATSSVAGGLAQLELNLP